MFLNFDITHVPNDVQRIAAKVAKWTAQVREDLCKGEVKAAAAYIPEGEADREALIGILDTAISTLVKIESTDLRGITARLQAVGSDLTALSHASKKHTISFYIICFETVFRDLFASK